MRIRVKLFALLGDYLPAGADRNEADLEAEAGATPAAVLRRLGVPREHCHLVLVNGFYVAPSEHARYALKDGDHLAVWPPVAGG
jgi:sulfur carrier protein ThiS